MTSDTKLLSDVGDESETSRLNAREKFNKVPGYTIVDSHERINNNSVCGQCPISSSFLGSAMRIHTESCVYDDSTQQFFALSDDVPLLNVCLYVIISS